MDMTTLIIIVAVVALVMFLLNRNRTMSNGPYGRPYTTGNQRPTYDDPNYTSSGSVGGTIEPVYDDPTYSSSGSIGRTVEQAPEPPQERGVSGVQSGKKYDDPKYRSGGSIGG